ncbi:MAG: AAA family ATPase [Chloroflexota bacterium]|nr:AAA family ATPase [Chloroflexota bacterium]
MSENDLHLPNLTIRRFRGIQDLSIERLGRVTLIAGKNGVGKTTVLDAVRAYAARGQHAVLLSILGSREELTSSADEDGDKSVGPDWEALFYGRRILPDTDIVIGQTGTSRYLRVEATPVAGAKAAKWESNIRGVLMGNDGWMFRITYSDDEQAASRFSLRKASNSFEFSEETELPPVIRCESLGPNVLDNTAIARLWDKVALTDDEGRALEALRLVFGATIERVAVIGDVQSVTARLGRRAVVRLAGQERPVPLRSLGDGAVRLFGVALALANSQGGFLLIDEAENGIHHTIQRDFWRMALLTAQANNVQVFATTHSWDCVAGFAQAAVAAEGVEGALVRLDSDGEGIRAVEYSEEDLQVAAEQGIEVR